MSKYGKLEDCDPIFLKPGYIFRGACCDCGLVHDMVVEDEDNGIHGIAFKRHKRATAQLRRHNYGSLQQEGESKYKMGRKDTNDGARIPPI